MGDLLLVISSFSTYRVGSIGLLKVTLANNHHGFGQFSNKDADMAVEFFHRHVAPCVLGKALSLSLLDNLHDMVLSFEFNYKLMGTTFNKALAACDAALLDALGKSKQLPVYKIWNMSSSANQKVLVYASSISRSYASAESLVGQLKVVQERHGISRFKLKLGNRMSASPIPASREASELISECRRVLGPEVKVAFDCNGAFASGEVALKSVEACKDDVWFIEEPVPWYKSSSAKAYSASTPLLAGGEQEFRLDVWKLAISNKAFDIVQPDLGYCGGPSLARKICLLGLSQGLKVAPHSPQSDLHSIYAWHLVMSLNVNASEDQIGIELACINDGQQQVVLDEKTGRWSPPSVVLKGSLLVRNGTVTLEQVPGGGWGVEIDPAFLANAEAKHCDFKSSSARARNAVL